MSDEKRAPRVRLVPGAERHLLPALPARRKRALRQSQDAKSSQSAGRRGEAPGPYRPRRSSLRHDAQVVVRRSGDDRAHGGQERRSPFPAPYSNVRSRIFARRSTRRARWPSRLSASSNTKCSGSRRARRRAPRSTTKSPFSAARSGSRSRSVDSRPRRRLSSATRKTCGPDSSSRMTSRRCWPSYRRRSSP